MVSGLKALRGLRGGMQTWTLKLRQGKAASQVGIYEP